MTNSALITGASGYIGHHLAKHLLARGWRVAALTRNNSDLRGLEVQRCESDGSYAGVLAAVQAAHPTVVFHLASMIAANVTGPAIAAVIDANITLGAHLLEAMEQTGCSRLVNTGTYWEYDAAGNYAPNTLYAATKRAFADLITFYRNHRAIRATTLTLFDVYGPGDWRNKLLSILASAAREQKPVDMSPGEQRIDLVHVDDVVRGFEHAATLPEVSGHSDFALASGTQRSLREVVAVLEKAWGRTIPINWGLKPYADNQIMVPVSSLPPLPGWACRIGFEEGAKALWC